MVATNKIAKAKQEQGSCHKDCMLRGERSHCFFPLFLYVRGHLEQLFPLPMVNILCLLFWLSERESGYKENKCIFYAIFSKILSNLDTKFFL